MSKTHKDSIKLPLAGLTAAYGIAYLVALRGLSALDTLPSIQSQLGASLALTLLGYLISVVLTGQLDAVQKARLIFLRWHDPLPGGEAFTKWMLADRRIDVAGVKRKHGPLPQKRDEQNRLWYRLYKAVASDSSVEDASKHYLLSRDATFVALFMGFASSGALLWFGEGATLKSVFAGVCLVAFLLVWRSARLAGQRLVTQVLILNPDVEKPASLIWTP